MQRSPNVLRTHKRRMALALQGSGVRWFVGRPLACGIDASGSCTAPQSSADAGAPPSSAVAGVFVPESRSGSS